MVTTRPRSSLLLMGLRGSGKSTVGRLAAARSGLPFVDLDELTAARLGGGSIAQIWARLGEAAFRGAEAASLAAELEIAPALPRVIALGGGTPTAPGAAELLRRASASGSIVLVYLRASPAALRARLRGTDIDARPSLTGSGTLAEVEDVFAARDPLYRDLAKHIIEVDGRDAAELAAELCSLTC